MKLTKVIVKKWDACAEGYKYFLENFPQGGDYAAVQSKLHADKKFEWASWLTNAAWKAAFETPAEMYALTKSEVDQTIADAKDSPQSATGYGSTAASSGDGSTAASSGYGTVAFVAGIDGSAKAGDNGCIALCYYDGKRNRVLVGYVGEDGIEADTFYVARGGKLVKQV